MLKPEIVKAVELLASELKQRFEPPEYIPGCEVKDVDDKDQYAPNNGWIEAVVSRHNRQRCRWKGQFANIQTGCFVDVLFYPSYRVYTVAGQSGSGGLSIPSDATGTYYDNTSSSISASTVQQAIDVLATSLGFETKYNVKGDLIVASSDNNASRLPVGTDGYILTADSACDLGMNWKVNTGASVVNFEEKYNAKGDLIVASSDNNASRLPVGTNNYVLTANSACDLGMGWTSQRGTAFPGSPATGQQFFRTDLGWLCYYDGTRWLTSFEQSIQVPATTFTGSTSYALGSFRTDYAVYVTRVRTSLYIGGTNNGSNYWTVSWRGINAAYNAATTIKSETTSADSGSTWTQKESAPSTANPSNNVMLDFNVTKTGSPGNAQVVGTLFYRMIVT